MFCKNTRPTPASEVTYRLMTPDECLVLLDAHHQKWRAQSKSWPIETLSFDTSFDEWERPMLADDFGRAYFCYVFGCNPPRKLLRKVVDIGKNRTLRDVCELFSRYATIPVLPTHTYFGVHCSKANAFNTIRNMLQDTGADVSDLSPRSLLQDFATTNLSVVYRHVMKLCPRLVNNISEGVPDSAFRSLLALAVWFSIPVPIILHKCDVLNVFLGYAIWLAVFIFFCRSSYNATRTQFKDLLAFSDLCEVVAEYPTLAPSSSAP